MVKKLTRKHEQFFRELFKLLKKHKIDSIFHDGTIQIDWKDYQIHYMDLDPGKYELTVTPVKQTYDKQKVLK